MAVLMGLFVLVANAQRLQDQTISGYVTDADEKEPMIQATVQLFRAKDSTFVGGTVTDIRGNQRTP